MLWQSSVPDRRIQWVFLYFFHLFQTFHYFDHYACCEDESRAERFTLGNAGQFACAVLEFFKSFFLLLCQTSIEFFLIFADQLNKLIHSRSSLDIPFVWTYVAVVQIIKCCHKNCLLCSTNTYHKGGDKSSFLFALTFLNFYIQFTIKFQEGFIFYAFKKSMIIFRGQHSKFINIFTKILINQLNMLNY